MSGSNNAIFKKNGPEARGPGPQEHTGPGLVFLLAPFPFAFEQFPGLLAPSRHPPSHKKSRDGDDDQQCLDTVSPAHGLSAPPLDTDPYCPR
jgi:hypothetical protein